MVRPTPKFLSFDVIEALHEWMTEGERPDAMGLHDFLNERFNLGWGEYEGENENVGDVLKMFVTSHVGRT